MIPVNRQNVVGVMYKTTQNFRKIEGFIILYFVPIRVMVVQIFKLLGLIINNNKFVCEDAKMVKIRRRSLSGKLIQRYNSKFIIIYNKNKS